ncbi:unnamed protein product [Clonostachys rosea]|uniref:F-box domain-containing protein n=1 Tax=Bionectria ochroleuca TaxID=29856 RepID=A0ABY6UIN2_BIOOC|nr:unnamed protein product [Clonostachys rosea]
MHRLPYDVLRLIADHLRYSDVASWLLTCRRLERNVTPVLYDMPKSYAASLNTTHREDARDQNERDESGIGEDDQGIHSRALIAIWAAKNGYVNTIKKVVAVEDISPLLHKRVPRQGLQAKLGTLGMTPMHQAALYGNADVVDLLVELGASADVTVGGFLSPLHLARNEAVIRALVKHGASIPDAEASPISPMVYSISVGSEPSATRCFLELGCDPNALSLQGLSAGHLAIQRGQPETLELLLDAGLDVSDPAPRIGSLISHAITTHQSSNPGMALQMVTSLLDHGAPAHGGKLVQWDSYFCIPCLLSNLLFATREDRPEAMIRLLLSRGARTATAVRWPKESARLSGWSGWRDAVAASWVILINPVTQLASRVDWSTTSSIAESFTTLSLLVARDVTKDGPRRLWRALLAEFATVRRDETWDELTLFMLDQGLDILFQNHGVSDEERLDMILVAPELLEGFDTKPMLKTVERLLKSGVDPNARWMHATRTRLMDVCMTQRNVKMARVIWLLIQHGADVNYYDFRRGWFPKNALECLIWDGESILCGETLARFEALLSSGNLDVNPPGNGRYGPPLLSMARMKVGSSLGYAVRVKIISLLLRHGADINVVSGSWLDVPKDTKQSKELAGDFEGKLSHTYGPILTSSATPTDLRSSTEMQTWVKQLTGEAEPITPYGWDLRRARSIFPDYVCDGGTALHFASVCADAETMKLLLKNGGRQLVNAKSTPGFTPLTTLVYAAGHSRMAIEDFSAKKKLLLRYGADTSLLSTKGQTAWDLCMELQEKKPWLKGSVIDDLHPDARPNWYEMQVKRILY